MAKVRCPKCGLEGEAGGFCENCGPDVGRLGAPDGAHTPVAVREDVRPPAAASVGEMPFAASVTFPETMWVGVASPLKISFRADRDIYSDVSAAILNCEDELGRRRHGCRPFTDEIHFSFNMKPRLPGSPVELTARFECRRDGSKEPDVFEAAFPVRVLEELAHHININASTLVSGTGASVIQYKNSTGGGLDLPADRRFDEAKGVTLPLAVELAASPRRLTLESGVGAIHLLALGPDETLVCGRHDDCDIRLRAFDKATGAFDDEKSERISRRHFRIIVSGGRSLRIADGAGAPSAWGTFIDGAAVPAGGIAIGEGECRIVLGEREMPGGILALRLNAVRRSGESLAGFTLSRDDGLDERIVAVVNRSVPLDGCDFAWDGRCFRCDGRKVVPGLSVEVFGKRYEAMAYRQRKK